MNACCRETRNGILADLLQAEAIDAKHGLRLPGDSALYIVLWNLECAKGDEERESGPLSNTPHDQAVADGPEEA